MLAVSKLQKNTNKNLHAFSQRFPPTIYYSKRWHITLGPGIF